MLSPNVAALIEAADLNGLLRVVDGFCATGEWEQLLELADRCEDAIERGKQLWPIAAHVDYRLALEAPGELAASVLDPGFGRFAVGPLTEVAAFRHSWDELAPYIEDSRVAAYVAQERVLRGEVLDGDERSHTEVLELPARILEWEPTYALASYGHNYVEVAEPWDPKQPLHEENISTGDKIDDAELEDALLDLVQPWTAESNGAARVAVVQGDATAAASVLTYGTLRMGPLEGAEALQRVAWAAASGGAYGRRRGAALGRSMAWYSAALLADVPWPPSDEFGQEIAGLRWYRWDEGAEEKGWVLRLAVENPAQGWSAAIGATDISEQDED
jgi:resuscitation-promoting factor RpfA